MAGDVCGEGEEDILEDVWVLGEDDEEGVNHQAMVSYDESYTAKVFSEVFRDDKDAGVVFCLVYCFT